MELTEEGKTTSLIEEAIYLLGDLPEQYEVFITGAHTNWIHNLAKIFKSEGLFGVRFVSPLEIASGFLRGRLGILLIDDASDLSYETLFFLKLEQKRLRSQLEYDYSSNS